MSFDFIVLILQVWGGMFYTFQKLFFFLAEVFSGERSELQWRRRSWVVCMIGMPAWVSIFIFQKAWMFAALEIGLLPSILLGFANAKKEEIEEATPLLLRHCALVASSLGIGVSVFYFKGIRQPSQLLELLGVVACLLGTYQLAERRLGGYFLYLLMNVATGSLMWLKGLPGLCLQQAVSFLLVFMAYLVALCRPARARHTPHL